MKTYLGYGVYVEEFAKHFTLTTEEEPDEPLNMIQLEPKMAVALVAYIQKKMKG